MTAGEILYPRIYEPWAMTVPADTRNKLLKAEIVFQMIGGSNEGNETDI